MVIKEVSARSILSASRVYDYTINPYTGCRIIDLLLCPLYEEVYGDGERGGNLWM
jgi:hypothetical protein